jgi:hypothetical protein
MRIFRTMKTRCKAIVFVMITAVVAAVIMWVCVSYRRAASLQWGRGALKVSERAYYTSRTKNIIQKWRDLPHDVPTDAARRFVRPYHLYLLIDANKKMIWIENNGAVLSSHCLRLPQRMTWDVFHHDSPDSSTKLPRLVRLQLRGANGARWQPERIYLVGYDEAGPELRIAVHQTRWPDGRQEGDHGQKEMGAGQESDLAYYESVVVSDAEYKANQRLLADTAGADQWTGIDEPSVLKDNRAAWLKVEKAFYQAIERHLFEAGLELERVEVACGPEFTAGHAVWGANRSSPVRYYIGRVLGRSVRRISYIKGYVKIERVGDELWYVKSAPHKRHTQGAEQIFEFLVSPAGRISRSQRERGLRQARKKLESTSVPRSPWQGSLPNGATVEFVGLCQSPSVGRQWWGPNGSAIWHTPYYATGDVPPEESHEKAYELVWRVHWPEHAKAKRYDCECFVQEPARRHSRQAFDRYGERLASQLTGEGGWYANTCRFKEDQKKATLKLRVRVGDQKYQRVSFENISLVPGKEYGFRIEVEQ